MFARSLVVIAVLWSAVPPVPSRAGESKRPITKPKYDPAARQVDLFKGIDERSLDVTMRPRNEFGGNVFFHNRTEQPITVLLPDAIVGIHVHPQFGGIGGGAGGGALGGQGGIGGQGGQNQAIGGGLGGGGGGGFGGAGGGQQGGFFSIPPLETVRIPFASVCLEHGKHSPTPRNTYRVVAVETYSDKPELRVLCAAVGSGQVDRAAAQAAAWNIASGMSWEQLQRKMFDRAAEADSPYFTVPQLIAAKGIVSASVRQSQERTATKEVQTTISGSPSQKSPAAGRAD